MPEDSNSHRDTDTKQQDHVPIVGRVRRKRLDVDRLVEPTRSMAFLGVARVDDPLAMSTRLAEEVSQKAFHLLVTFRQMDAESETRKYECQVSLIRKVGSSTSGATNYTVRPVTAKHNIANGEVDDDGVVEEFLLAQLRIPPNRAGGIPKDIFVEFREAGCNKKYCENHHKKECCCNNVIWGEGVTNKTLVLPSSSFELVRPDFQCEIGQRVAIMVYSEDGVTPESASAPAGYPQEELERIYGKAKQVIILTGRITQVGSDGRIC